MICFLNMFQKKINYINSQKVIVILSEKKKKIKLLSSSLVGVIQF